jgi:hypothetical protein
MSISTCERVECDHCGKTVTLRADDTIPHHGWTRRGVFHECPDTGERYARHMVMFFCANNPGRPWVGQCRCGALWTDPDYKVVEAQWEAHVPASGGAS